MNMLDKAELKKPKNRKEWLQAYSHGGCCYNWNKRYDENFGIALGEWPKCREISVFRESTVKKKCADTVIYGIYESLDDIGLNLDVNDFDTSSKVSSIMHSLTINYPLRKYGNRIYRGGKAIDADKLAEHLLTEIYKNSNNGGSQHAIVIITDKNFEDKGWNYNCGKIVDGTANFGNGFAFISIPNYRQDSSSQRSVEQTTRHELPHMLGLCGNGNWNDEFYFHHNEPRNIRGYSEPKSCVMGLPIRTRKLCEIDKEALQVFWKALEKDFHMKFLK